MDGAILLQDSPGEKTNASIVGTVKNFLAGRKSSSPVVVVRGELLVPIPGDEITPRKTPHNYRSKRDPTISLYCKGDDVAPLGEYEVWLLEGIKSQTTRYEVFISASNILDWGSRLKPGNMVYVVIPDQHTAPVQYAAAVIRYVGGLKTEPGIQFGVEITERQFHGCGSTNGSFQGEQYFLCEEDCGLFVGLDKLSPDHQGGCVKPSSQDESSTRMTPASNQQHSDGSHQHSIESRFRESGNTPEAAPAVNFTPPLKNIQKKRTQTKTSEIEEVLQEKCSKFEAQSSQARHEKQNLQERYTYLEEQLQQQKQQHTRLEQQLRQERQEAAQERQAAAELKQQLEHQLQGLIADNQRLQQQVADSQPEAQQTRLIQPQSTLEAIEYWKVPRRDIQIIREVGVGAWGSVSEGKYRDQLVAVKQPHRAILTTPIVKRLQREVQIMAQVRHPNLVRFIAAVFDDKVQWLEEPPMIILELLDMNLRTAYERDVLGASKIPIFRDIAYALHYLHEHQDPIIHRDISTPNVLLEALPQGAWKAKVSDFGSANLEKRSKTVGEGAIIYSAPETFPHTDPTTLPPPQTTKIDVFSYGILLCEVITKQLPEDPTIYRQMLQQVKSQWLFMYDLIVSCTKRDPNERPAMAQVLDKLNKLPRPRPRVHQHS